MKQLFFLLLLFSVYFSHGQEKIVKKPEYVIIANDTIITMEKVNEYEIQGYLKSMRREIGKCIVQSLKVEKK
jgi:hypothetical protein